MESRKGALVLRFGVRPRSLSTHLLSGGLGIGIFTFEKSGDRALHFEAIDALRPLGSDAPPTNLAAPVFTLGTLKTARTVLRVFRRTGSLRKAADRAEIFGGDGFFEVRFNYRRKGAAAWLRFARDLKELGKVKTVKCRRWNNIPGTVSSR